MGSARSIEVRCIVELQPAIAGILLFAVGVSFTLFTANANALVQLGARTTCAGE